ncbi:MAG: thiol reductase thioredoxin [Streptosporangiales bacterium]|nr:thiol reductase thioredoxin [Streptosporangiales bacterium]
MTTASSEGTVEIVDVTEATFAELVLRSGTPVLVEFWGRGCAPCRMLAPILAEIAAEFAGRLRVVRVDGDYESALVIAGGVMGFPTLHLYKAGELVSSIVGVRSKARLLGALREAL